MHRILFFGIAVALAMPARADAAPGALRTVEGAQPYALKSQQLFFESSTSGIAIFNLSSPTKQIGTITNGLPANYIVSGTDAAGNLYLTVPSVNQPTILMYAPPYTGAPTSCTSGDAFVVKPNGTIYGVYYPGAGGVTTWSGCKAVSYVSTFWSQNGTEPIGVSSTGDIYQGMFPYDSSGCEGIVEWPAGSAEAVDTGICLDVGRPEYGGMAIDANDNLLVAQPAVPGIPPTISIFSLRNRNPKFPWFLEPSSVINNVGPVTFDASRTHLFTQSLTKPNAVEELSYPGFKVVKPVVGLNSGGSFAVFPPAP